MISEATLSRSVNFARKELFFACQDLKRLQFSGTEEGKCRNTDVSH